MQAALFLIITKQREKGLKITDKRVRLTTEVLQGIRLIKMYGWEAFYYKQISDFREKEIKTVRKASYGFSCGPCSMCIITSNISQLCGGLALRFVLVYTCASVYSLFRGSSSCISCTF